LARRSELASLFVPLPYPSNRAAFVAKTSQLCGEVSNNQSGLTLRHKASDAPHHLQAQTPLNET
jgi:hypothetical protein